MKKLAIATFCASTCFSLPTNADGWPNWLPETTAVPFAFTSESIGNSIGFAGVMKGVGQPQAGLLASGFVSDKGSHVVYASANNYLFSEQSRWVLSAEAFQARFKDSYYYLGDANNHGSELDQRTNADGDEAQYRLSARYILPMGMASNHVIEGLLPQRELTGGMPWNSGVSSIELRPFFIRQDLGESQGDMTSEIWGLETVFDWDNRDDVRNPTQGSRSKFHLHYDAGNDQRASWLKWEWNQSWFYELGKQSEWTNRQVLAFNLYASDVPTWNSTESVNGTEEYRRPPDYAASRLGGLFRLRGYAGGRYADRSALHYSFEYRVMPKWQPLSEWPVFNWYDVPWWQWVAFVDAGRVADEFNLETLHDDMQWSVGGAVRFQVEGIVVRTEMAWSEQDSVFRVMVNQPF